MPNPGKTDKERMMRLLSFVLILFSACSVLAKNQWTNSGWSVGRTKYGDVRSLLVQKKVKTAVTDISVLSVSFVEIPLTSLKQKNEAGIAEEIATSLGLKNWTVTSKKNYSVFEKKWSDENRYLRLMVKTNGTTAKISLANARLGYAFPSLLEADYLQQRWYGEKFNRKKIKKTALLWKMLFNEAVADPPTSTDVQAYVDQLSGSISGAGDSISGAIRDSGSLSGIGDTIQSIPDTVNNASTSLTNASVSLNNASVSVDNASGAVDRFGDTLTRITSVRSMFLIGLSLQAGQSVGAVVGNFLIDGTTSAVKSMYYFIAQKLDPETRDKMMRRSHVALDTLSTQSKALADIEKKIDVHLLALEFATQNPGEDLAINAGARIVLAENEIKKIEAAMAADKDSRNLKQCAQQIAVLRQSIDLLKLMQPVLQTQNRSQMCNDLQTELFDWMQAEKNLNDAKEIIKQDMLMIYTGTLEATNSSLEVLGADGRTENACEDQVDDLKKRKKALKKPDTDPAIVSINQSISNLKKRCQRMAEYRKGRDPAQSLQISLEEADRASSAAEEYYKRLQASDCKASETSKFCNGKEGLMEALRKKYDKRAELADIECKGALPKAQKLAGQSTATAGGAAMPDLSSSGAAAQNFKWTQSTIATDNTPQ